MKLDMVNLDVLMTLDEVCAWLRMSSQAVKKLCREGSIPCAKIGKSWRFSKKSLEQWLENQNSLK
jgi:excisionase family DNA binding protein